MITRYRLEYDDLDVYDNGNLVKYEDHQHEVTQLQARVAELEAAIGRLHKTGSMFLRLSGRGALDGPAREDFARELAVARVRP